LQPAYTVSFLVQAVSQHQADNGQHVVANLEDQLVQVLGLLDERKAEISKLNADKGKLIDLVEFYKFTLRVPPEPPVVPPPEMSKEM
jgi:hypothetical protein